MESLSLPKYFPHVRFARTDSTLHPSQLVTMSIRIEIVSFCIWLVRRVWRRPPPALVVAAVAEEDDDVTDADIEELRAFMNAHSGI